MKSFRIPIFKKIVGAIGKAIGPDDSALVARADGIYRVYNSGGSVVEKKLFDQSHEEEVKGMATGLGENIGSVRKIFNPGDTLRAEELASISSGTPTQAKVTGTTSIAPVSNFETLRDALDNGKFSFRHNVDTFQDVEVSLANQKFAEQEIVNHVNYAGQAAGTVIRGMTIAIPVTGRDQGIVNQIKIYLAAGETYSVKIYDGNSLASLVHTAEVIATHSKFYTIDFPDHLIDAGASITVTVEAASFNYYYPVATPGYTQSWSDTTPDGVFEIQNTLPIKLNVIPAIGIKSGDIESIHPFIVQKIVELTGVTPTVVYTDKFEISFPAGYREFEILDSASVDLAPMLGFTAGRVTVFGEGASTPLEAAGKIVRVGESGTIATGLVGKLISSITHTSLSAITVPTGTKKIVLDIQAKDYDANRYLAMQMTLDEIVTSSRFGGLWNDSINYSSAYTVSWNLETMEVSITKTGGYGNIDSIDINVYFIG